MDPSSAQHQEMSSQTLESMLVCTKSEQEKKPRPAEQQAQKCPRCDSANTKFCYYNNYSLSQPRYFCKSCRRYWTKGGTLRNVPVGGGCRKKQKSSSKRSTQDYNSPNNPIISPLTVPLSSYDSSTDLSLAFARLQKQANGHLGIDQQHENNNNNMSMMYNPTAPSSFLHSPRGGSFLENAPNGFYHNMYYGNMGQVEDGGLVEMGMNYDQEMSVTTTTASTTLKQEMCSMARDQGENNSKIFWGFPWQNINGDVNNMSMGDFESSNRQSCTEFGGSSWHGHINSPLM
ncbi:hypothetical protein RND71_009848 [Anisodus tanguticus]|uniref:Dof zinc finger protein n=1 Tax=Anisodus tanguticus TaxID=243964 RepID=A0AAE1VHL0_9SOLA|nr:hypothetical protein RND71_009847 [Anisodus tanguticus]KAK4370373.1 hypothetical protein RND71_009848 [Anisodus tanguticus]